MDTQTNLQASTVIGRLFLRYYHRSDKSLSVRLALVLIGTVCFAATGGSFFTLMILCGGVLSLVYLAQYPDQLKFEGGEWAILALFCAYVGYGVIISIVNGESPDDMKAHLANGLFPLAAWFMVVCRAFYRPYWAEWLRAGAGWGGIAAAIIALVSLWVHPLERASGMAGNPSVFGYLSAQVAILCAVAMLFARTTRMSALCMLGLAGAIVAVFLSGGRSTVAMMALVLLPIVCVAVARLFKANVGYVLYAGWWTILLAIFVYEYSADNPSVMRLTAFFSDVVSSADGEGGVVIAQLADRIEMWTTGWQAFLQSPVFGQGRQNVMTVARAMGLNPDFSFTHLHNAYLTELVAGGVVGLVLFLGVLATPFIASIGRSLEIRIVAYSCGVFWLLYIATHIGFYHDLTVAYFCGLVVLINSFPKVRAADQRLMLEYQHFKEWREEKNAGVVTGGGLVDARASTTIKAHLPSEIALTPAITL